MESLLKWKRSRSNGAVRRVYRPSMEAMEARLVLSTAHSLAHLQAFLVPDGYTAATQAARPVLPQSADPAVASFIDPTAVIDRGTHVGVKGQSYIAPFAILMAGRNKILLGQGSNIQDNVMVDARGGDVV